VGVVESVAIEAAPDNQQQVPEVDEAALEQEAQENEELAQSLGMTVAEMKAIDAAMADDAEMEKHYREAFEASVPAFEHIQYAAS
jgi:hypothetical protein